MQEVLIIKVGYSETLENKTGRIVNLGDVLRTTVILHFLKDSQVTWLVDEKAMPLLKNNPYIYEILSFDPSTIDALKGKRFDIVINFEKGTEFLSLCKSLNIGKIYGFKDNTFFTNFTSYKKSHLEIMCESVKKRKENKDCWQKILAASIDKKWNFEDYILEYKPKEKERHDIGFNWTTGSRWSNKAWPLTYWKKLEELLKNEYSISWQRGYDDLYEYMDWINSCSLIATADTLGLHLGLAFKKRVVGLFGPTPSHEFYFYDRGTYLLPDSPYNCISCLTTFCSKDKPCMEYISPEKVKETIDYEFKKVTASRSI